MSLCLKWGRRKDGERGVERGEGLKKKKKKVNEEEFVLRDATPSFCPLRVRRSDEGAPVAERRRGGDGAAWHIGWLIQKSVCLLLRRGNTQEERVQHRGRAKIMSVRVCVCVWVCPCVRYGCEGQFLRPGGQKQIKVFTRKPSRVMDPNWTVTANGCKWGRTVSKCGTQRTPTRSGWLIRLQKAPRNKTPVSLRQSFFFPFFSRGASEMMSRDPAKWRSGRSHLLTLRRSSPGKKEKKLGSDARAIIYGLNQRAPAPPEQLPVSYSFHYPPLLPLPVFSASLVNTTTFWGGVRVL